MGVTANVIQHHTLPDGTVKIFVEGLQRTAIIRLIDKEYLEAEVVPIKESRGLSAEAVTLSQSVLDAYQIYANVDFSSLTLGPVRLRLPSIGDPGLLADRPAPTSLGYSRLRHHCGEPPGDLSCMSVLDRYARMRRRGAEESASKILSTDIRAPGVWEFTLRH